MAYQSHRIIIVDEDGRFCKDLEALLAKESCETASITDPYQALPAAHGFEPDLFVIDVDMAELGGMQLCRIIRAIDKFEFTPIILVTATNIQEERIKAYECGCDSLFNKPINLKEFTLSIKAILKRSTRSHEVEDMTHVMTTDTLKLDKEKRLVSVNNEIISLTPIQYRLLKCLLENKGHIQTREHLKNTIWPHIKKMESRSIDVHIRRLRQKLNGCGDLIETVHGIGYRVTK